jgi:hypothetical protein
VPVRHHCQCYPPPPLPVAPPPLPPSPVYFLPSFISSKMSLTDVRAARAKRPLCVRGGQQQLRPWKSTSQVRERCPGHRSLATCWWIRCHNCTERHQEKVLVPAFCQRLLLPPFERLVLLTGIVACQWGATGTVAVLRLGPKQYLFDGWAAARGLGLTWKYFERRNVDTPLLCSVVVAPDYLLA